MCTSLTYENSPGDHFLARTMDYDLDVDAQVMYLPRNWTVAGDAGEFTTKYGFIGAGRKLNHELYIDGVNEHGLGVAMLYFPENAKYVTAAAAGKTGVAPQDFVAWALGNAKTVAELRDLVHHIQLVDKPADLIHFTPPLHFIISDDTGATALLEPVGPDLNLIDDPIGVMTNSPDLNWHLQNLSTYGALTNEERPLHHYLGFRSKTQGPGTGALGLPGDYTSPSRFIRTAFLKDYAEPTHDVASSLNLLQHILNAVTIPKGVKLKTNGHCDFTQYRAFLSLSERAYYVEPYHNLALQRVALTTDLLTSTRPVTYSLNKYLSVEDLPADHAITHE